MNCCFLTQSVAVMTAVVAVPTGRWRSTVTRSYRRLVYRRSDGSLAINRDRSLVHSGEQSRDDSVSAIVLDVFHL